MPTFFDLSQPIEPGMSFFPGDPQPRLQPAQGVLAPWQVTRLSLGSHTGTHIDAASHYFPAGKTISQYPPERFVLPGMLLRLPDLAEDQPIGEEQMRIALEGFQPGGAVLIQTGWDRYWKTDRYLRHPYLSTQAAQWLAERGASLVGIDALNVDSTVQGTEYVHHILLGKDILIVENLAGLARLQPGVIYQFSCLPLRLAGIDGSPVRAVAWQG